MKFLVQNRILTDNNERTFITTGTAIAATAFQVRAVNASAWADNDYVIVGEIGAPNAEILQINGAVSSGTSLTLDNNGSGGARFAHSPDEPIYHINYNQVKFYRSTTVDGSKTLLSTGNILPNDFETRYEDSTNTTGFGFAAFFNSFTSGLSPFSDAIPYDGQSSRSLQMMIQKIRSLTDEQDDNFLQDSEIIEAINDKQRDIINERLWTFDEGESSDSTIANQFAYDLPDIFKTLHTCRVRTEPSGLIGQQKWEMLFWQTTNTAVIPTNVCIFQEQAKFYPRPGASANATQLDGAINSTTTSITVDNSTGFTIGDYYRFIIDSEVIYATAVTTNTSNYTFTGCIRAMEGTTAASHLDNAVVTERDIVYTGQLKPVDLQQYNDETIVPEPLVICYGVASDFCLSKLNKETLGDRYKLRYDEGMSGLRDRYNLKMTSAFGRVKDPREVMSDNGRYPNPNNYPQNVIAP